LIKVPVVRWSGAEPGHWNESNYYWSGATVKKALGKVLLTVACGAEGERFWGPSPQTHSQPGLRPGPPYMRVTHFGLKVPDPCYLAYLKNQR
jgi:hypothetical protein